MHPLFITWLVSFSPFIQQLEWVNSRLDSLDYLLFSLRVHLEDQEYSIWPHYRLIMDLLYSGTEGSDQIYHYERGVVKSERKNEYPSIFQWFMGSRMDVEGEKSTVRWWDIWWWTCCSWEIEWRSKFIIYTLNRSISLLCGIESRERKCW